MDRQKAFDVPPQPIDTLCQAVGTALDGAKSDDPIIFVDRDKIDLGIVPIPVPVDPVGEREVAHAPSAPLLVELGRQTLETMSLCLREALVGLVHQADERLA